MDEILDVVNLVPALVTRRTDDGRNITLIVYLDYASKKVINDSGTYNDDFNKLVFEYIANKKTKAFVPEIPRSGFSVIPKKPNNSE